MNAVKETRPGEATPRRAEAGETACSGASNSYRYLTTTPGGCQVGIAALLTPGKANGRKCADLAAAVGTDGRTLRRQIQAARLSGALILSSPATGYFLPENTEELKAFIKSMRHRCAEISAVTRAAEDALNELSGQLTIPGW